MLKRSPLTDRLLRIENLFWAWEKAKAAYSFDKTWFDELELATFESDLRRNLLDIRRRLETGRYELAGARPVAFPKRGETRQQPATRQMFWFSVADQVAWLAVVNVVGPSLDRLMPAWSYGDRLYRSVWRAKPESEDPTSHGSLKVGPYRHSSRHLYRPFKYAWPRYRRHLYLSAIIMAHGGNTAALSSDDRAVLDDEVSVVSDKIRVPYLNSGYWHRPAGHVYWASIDLKKFFPNTPLSLVRTRMIDGLNRTRYRGEFDELIGSMLEFPIDANGWTATELRNDLDLDIGAGRPLRGIPTGLLVSGFLANVAMLGVDQTVDAELRTNDERSSHEVAHFRYVDDHTVLATEPDQLVHWLVRYQGLLREANPDWTANLKKTEPAAVRDHLTALDAGGDPDLSRIRGEPLDSEFPRPLLSHTLAKISAVAGTRFELLDDDGQTQFIHDVEMLLLADFGDTEVRPETRASFAASVLARSDLHLRRQTTAMWQARHDLRGCQARLLWLERETAKYLAESVPEPIGLELQALREKLAGLQLADRRSTAALVERRVRDKARHFRLILSAIRRFPDKIRLWLTAVRYCGRVGHKGLAELAVLLQDTTVVSPITQSYVSGVVAHGIAGEIVRAVRILAKEAVDEETREVAAAFLESAASRSFAMSARTRWYERRAVAMLTAASWAAAVTLEAARPSNLLEAAGQRRQHPRFRAVEGGHGNPKAAARQTRRLGRAVVTPSALALWLQRSLDSPSAEPTVVWRELAAMLDPQEPGTASFFGRFPGEVPLSTLKGMISGTVAPISDNQGWYYEAVAFRPHTERDELRRVSGRAKGRIARLVKPLLRQKIPRGFTNLVWWTDWLRDYPGRGPQSLERASDPRRGEWTSLHIVRLISRELRKKRRASRPTIHHATVLLPASWMKVPGTAPGGLSWQEWMHVARRGRVSFLLPEISDERYMGPAWRLESTAPPDWPWIRGLGLVLLGLLNKSFVWPSPWNPDFWQNGRPEIVGQAVAKASCSSVTTAILQSTLAARSRENVVRRHDLKDEQVDPDTLFDPPFIGSLLDFERWVGRSMHALERHQMSGHQGRPRQLVPVMLKQLTRPEWSEWSEWVE